MVPKKHIYIYYIKQENVLNQTYDYMAVLWMYAWIDVQPLDFRYP